MTDFPLQRHFVLRKLHSLLGIVPIGAFRRDKPAIQRSHSCCSSRGLSTPDRVSISQSGVIRPPAARRMNASLNSPLACDRARR